MQGKIQMQICKFSTNHSARPLSVTQACCITVSSLSAQMPRVRQASTPYIAYTPPLPRTGSLHTVSGESRQ